MKHFTTPSASAIWDIDMALSQDARDLKSIVVNHKDILDELRSLVTNHLSAVHNNSNIMEKCSQNAFKIIMRNVFTLGSGLSYNKELRDIFASLLEKIVEPCVGLGWNSSDMELFFSAVSNCFESVETLQLHYRKRYKSGFCRLFNAMREICIKYL